MNEYKWDDLYVKQKESFSIKISSEMMSKFLDITDDVNPLHNNKDFALNYGFKDKVVYGMLTASFISTLAGVYLPGKNCLIQSVETKFLKPVYINDVIELIGEIKEKHDSVKQLCIAITMINQNSEKVLKGILKAGILS